MRLIDADELLTDNTWEWFDEWGNCTAAGEAIMGAPTIDAEPVVHCRECRYFKKDWWYKKDGVYVPRIVAHEVCEFWGHGCKTEKNSYCSNGERREP